MASHFQFPVRVRGARSGAGQSARRPFRAAIQSVAVAIALGSALSAFGQSSWDRRAEQIAIVSVPGDPVGTYRVSGAWVVEASGVTTLPLGTVVTMTKNGTPVGTQVVDVAATIGCNFCPFQNPCLCVEPAGPCACSALWLTTEFPTPVALDPGDVLKLNVTAAPGAAADTVTANDSISRTFFGNQAFWNRRVVSATLVPSPCPEESDLYDLQIAVAFDFSDLGGSIPMAANFELQVNGQAITSGLSFCDDDPWLTSASGCTWGGQCGLATCGSGSCAGSNVTLSCQFVELHGGALATCVCSSGTLQFAIADLKLVGLTPQSSIIATLVADQGKSLAEIPSLAGDNVVAVAFGNPSLRCAADLNGDGVVDGADLGMLLQAWGKCR